MLYDHIQANEFQSSLPRGERPKTTGAGRPETTNFNPRSHEGSDPLPASVPDGFSISILAPTRGATDNTGKTAGRLIISILAPTRGATTVSELRQLVTVISILAPTRGATQNYSVVDSSSLFQSSLPRGERLYLSPGHRVAALFQSSLPRGERPVKTIYVPDCNNFNPRSHEGSDSNFRQKVLFSLSKNCLKYLILTTNYFN